MNLLSLLHCVVYGVSPGQMPWQIYRYWWIHFRRIMLVRGHSWCCVDGVGLEGVLVIGFICVFESASDIPSKGSYWDISVVCLDRW